MDDRLSVLYSLISSGDVFADVGCDHGFISEKVLENNKFKKVIISDISEKSLNKAKKLLERFGDRVISYVSDGFNNYLIKPDEAIIAGMGGEEIIKILSNSLFRVDKLVLSPQKNSSSVREYLLNNGYHLDLDYTIFVKGKYYDVIKCSTGLDNYSPLEIKYGRNNLNDYPDGFIKFLEKKINIYYQSLKENMLETNKEDVENKLRELLNIYENRGNISKY